MHQTAETTIKECSSCKAQPLCTVEHGEGYTYAWFICGGCGRSTADQQSFRAALSQWNAGSVGIDVGRGPL